VSAIGVVILIPAYQPISALVELVCAMTSLGARVVVVDDGSEAAFAPLFAAVRRIEGVELLRHVVNLGKGAALKTGLNHIACRYPDCVGVVTADADGQHSAQDVLAVAAALADHPRDMVLGVRRFEGKLPLRSRLGNTLTRLILRLVSGQKISDTQTGLRGIPLWLIPRLLLIPCRGYEFELEMLLVCKYRGIRICETPIQTIYLEDNRSSHFNPFWDSARIYFVLLRFLGVSLITAVLDNLVFALVFSAWPTLVGAQVTGRVLCTLFNYWGNKTTVFRSEQRAAKTLPRYLLLVAVSGGISYGLIQLFCSWGTLDVVAAKMLAESILFLFNFAVQREFIFPKLEPGPP
jgi:putative flippase GtrA